MESQINSQDQSNQQVGQSPLVQPVASPPKPKINYLMIGGVVLLCLLIFGFGGYYLGKQSSYTAQQTSLQPTLSPSLVPSSQPLNALPTGWSYKSDACGVRFPIPPKEVPYYQVPNPNRQPSVTSEEGSGRFWDFPRGGSYPNLLSKLLTGN